MNISFKNVQTKHTLLSRHVENGYKKTCKNGLIETIQKRERKLDVKIESSMENRGVEDDMDVRMR